MTTTAKEPERLLDKDEIAQLVGVSPRTVKHYGAQGKIPVIRISPRLNRYSPSRVLEALKKFETREAQ